MPPGRSEALARRFWSKVDIRGPDECWPWTASRTDKGYGQFGWAKGDIRPASRVAYELANDVTLLPWPEEVARHTCDNPPCCNPRHLIKGSMSDNTMDAVERGRHPSQTSESYRESRKHLTGPRDPARGERNGFAKLTDDQVEEIREASRCGARQVDIAATFGIGQSHVSRIVRGVSR